MKEINNFQQEPDGNLYQAWERFKELLMKCPQYYLTDMQEVILFYNGLGILTRQILDSRGAIPSKTVADAKVAIQEMTEYSQKWNNGTSRSRSTETSDGLAAIQVQLKREIKKVNEKVYDAQVGCEQPIIPKIAHSKKKGKPSKKLTTRNLVLQEREFGSVPSSTKANQRDQVKSISTTIEADSCPIRRIGSSQYAVSTGQNRTLMYETRQTTILFPIHLNGYYCKQKKGSYGPQFSEAYSEASHINKSIPRKEKDPGRANVSVMPLLTYLNLGLGELAHTKLTVELADRIVKYPKGIAENVLVDCVKPASSLIKRVYMLSLRERMELDLEARLMEETLVNQGDDLMLTIKKGKVIEEFRTRDDELDIGIDDYPSYCDYDKKIHIDCAHDLKFSCMIGYEFTHANFFPLLYVNVISKKFHNSIMKDKMVYKGNNVVGALMNIPIFVGTFSVMMDFAIFRRYVCFDLITRMGDVSKEDMMNGISHPYQKLKGFYKGVLNLGPNYIRDAKMEEWLTCGHISVHEMEW
ncbi:hypothetical protein Tco_0935313 [Tanacetum coccineum]